MNLVGKIFTMLILVMSILFMAFAVAVYHTHRNWRDLAKKTQTRRSPSYRDENAQLRDERLQMENRLAHERAARRTALGSTRNSGPGEAAAIRGAQSAVHRPAGPTADGD